MYVYLWKSILIWMICLLSECSHLFLSKRLTNDKVCMNMCLQTKCMYIHTMLLERDTFNIYICMYICIWHIYYVCFTHTHLVCLLDFFEKKTKNKRRVDAKISAVREGKTGGALHHRHRRHQPPHKRSWYFELSIHSKPSSTLTPVFFWRNLQRISWVYSPPMTNSLHTLIFLHMYLRYIVSRTHCTTSIQKTWPVNSYGFLFCVFSCTSEFTSRIVILLPFFNEYMEIGKWVIRRALFFIRFFAQFYCKYFFCYAYNEQQKGIGDCPGLCVKTCPFILAQSAVISYIY